MVQIFKDGFESNSTAAWTGTLLGGLGTATVVDSTRHHGLYSLDCATPATAGAYGQVYKDIAAVTTIFVRTYSKISALPTSFLSIGPHIGDAGDVNDLMTLSWNGTNWYVVYKDNAGNHTLTNDVPTIRPNKWFCIEMREVFAAGTGIAQLYVNDRLVISATGLTNNIYTAAYVYVLAYCDVAQAYHSYYDDVIISDNYIGPEKIPMMFQNPRKTKNLRSKLQFNYNEKYPPIL